MQHLSETKTPYAVVCRDHGQRFLTKESYAYQMDRPDNKWICPVCGDVAEWDDANYEEYLDQQEQGEEELC